MTTAVSGPSMPRVRHGFLAAALLAVAALRLYLGDLVWAGVLAAAGLVEVYVGVRCRHGAPPRHRQPPPHRSPCPLPTSWTGPSSASGRDSCCGPACWSACIAAAALVVTAEPSLAIVLGCLALAACSGCGGPGAA